MKIIPVQLLTPSGGLVRRYYAKGEHAGVVFGVSGHTHMSAVHNAFRVMTGK